MITIFDALSSLGVTAWKLDDVPATENDFNRMFKKVVGSDESGSAIESSDPDNFGVTWNEIQAEITRLQADYAAKQYQRDRAAAYPSIPDQLDVIYHQGVDAWKEQIAAIKAAHPKPGA